MGVYQRIDDLRKSKGIKWNYLNEKLPGAYHGRMTELKNGKTTLNGEQLDAIAEILGTTSAYLLGATDDPAPAEEKEDPAADPGNGVKYPPGYELLTPENRAKADSYLAFLIAEQQNSQT